MTDNGLGGCFDTQSEPSVPFKLTVLNGRTTMLQGLFSLLLLSNDVFLLLAKFSSFPLGGAKNRRRCGSLQGSWLWNIKRYIVAFIIRGVVRRTIATLSMS